MSENENLTIANLDEKDIETIRELEKKPGEDICLVAVRKKDVLYALEAKMTPSEWTRVDSVYPEIEDLRAFYARLDQAKDAKAALKRLLLSSKIKTKEKKRPIRIRQIVTPAG